MLEIKENAAFLRCVEVMAKLIEKYGNEEDTYNDDTKTVEEVAN